MSEINREKLYKGISAIARRIDESEDRTWRLLRDGVIPGFQHTERGPWRMREGDYQDYLARIVRKPAA